MPLGSIRKASARLNVASSAINRQILALENELGAPIFERMPRRLRLTATGEVLIAHVRDTLKGHQRVEAHIEALKGLTRRGDDCHHERACRGRGRAFSAESRRASARDVDDPLERVEKHGRLRGRVGKAPAAATPRRAADVAYLSIVIGEKSWNQFFAWMKPFTFGLIARALTSCVTIRNSASSTYFS